MSALADLYPIPQEHADFRQTIRRIASEQVAPGAAEIDEKAAYPHDLRRLLAEQDIRGRPFEAEPGGTKITQIDEGKNEIQRLVIARTLR